MFDVYRHKTRYGDYCYFLQFENKEELEQIISFMKLLINDIYTEPEKVFALSTDIIEKRASHNEKYDTEDSYTSMIYSSEISGFLTICLEIIEKAIPLTIMRNHDIYKRQQETIELLKNTCEKLIELCKEKDTSLNRLEKLCGQYDDICDKSDEAYRKMENICDRFSNMCAYYKDLIDTLKDAVKNDRDEEALETLRFLVQQDEIMESEDTDF